MPADLAKLTQSELLKLLNGTPLGTVLTRSRLRRQMDAAALRIGDGSHIHLLRYIRWLALEHDRPKPGPMEYAEAKRRQAQRNRAATKAGQDVAPIPDVQNYKRRKAASKSLRTFCQTYFAPTYWRPWSKDHLRVLATIQAAILEGGLFAFAMPRGSGKTCLARTAAIWAVLSGHRPFVCLIGGSDDRAKELILPIRTHILTNDLLLADFPEAVHPLRCLENSAKRQLQQHIGGRLTHVHWADDKLVFATIAPEDLPETLRTRGLKASPSAGSIITITSLDANMRGQQHTRPDGSTIRPSLVLLDDPQTRRSARSPTQTKLRFQLLNGDVLAMAGPGEPIAAAMTCTKIYENDLADQLLDREKNPEWQGQCTKLIYALPTNAKLWERYAEVRADGLRRGDRGAEATKFYRKQRAEMDAGAIPAWPQRYHKATELSAIQNAMNLKLKVGAEAFASEYQNEPILEQLADDVLTAQKVAEKINGRRRATAPVACTAITMFVDVHDRLLYWCVAAWEPDFTGYVLDYGTLPAQGREWFIMRTARRTLRRMFPGAGEDGAIHGGLERLIAGSLQQNWQRSGGGALRIGRLLVDAGYKPGIVAAVKHKVGGETMMLSRGVGITASRIPMAQYRRKPGEKHGHHWYTPNVKGTTEFPHVALDANYWKSFVHRALATPAGDRGCLSLWGKKAKTHELFAEHVAGSEFSVETHGRGRSLREWRLKPSKPDNHWLDCLAATAAAAAMLGIVTPGMEARATRARKRYTQADLARRRR